MRIYLKTHIIILFLLISLYGKTQDVHYTQFYAGPLTLNPALTGFYNGSTRFVLNNKNQWRSVTVPFRSVSASIDKPFKRKLSKRDLIGAGISLSRELAGDSKFGTTQSSISVAYIRSLNRTNTRFISFGLMAGGAQRTIDYSKLMFDSQYNGYAFDPLLSNNESSLKSDLFFLDLSAGTCMHFIFGNKQDLNAGFAVFHINSPNQSLISNENIPLDRKYLFHANSRIDINKRSKFTPAFLLMFQGPYAEINFGSTYKYVKLSNSERYVAASFGTFYRVGDAVNFIAGLEYNNYSFGLSYDVNVSKLTPASRSRGGFELSLIYILRRSAKEYIKKIPCPIF